LDSSKIAADVRGPRDQRVDALREIVVHTSRMITATRGAA
jgi:hypothetical protein